MKALLFISWALALSIRTFPALAFSWANAGGRVRTMNSGARVRVRGLMMSVGKKDSYNIALLPGDGIGPEISKATQNALSPLEDRFKLNFREGLVGGAAIDATGTPWPVESAELAKSSDSVLFGAIGGPKVSFGELTDGGFLCDGFSQGSHPQYFFSNLILLSSNLSSFRWCILMQVGRTRAGKASGDRPPCNEERTRALCQHSPC